MDAFESSANGPLFVSSGAFPRLPAGTLELGDGRDDDRALMVVHQALLDHAYNGRGVVQPVVAPCSISLLTGRAWRTASYYPGSCAPPADPSVVRTR